MTASARVASEALHARARAMIGAFEEGREPPEAFDAARRDVILAQNLAALNDAPAGRFQGGVDMFRSRLGFVHFGLEISAERLL